jgi:protein-tyrosine phosphatase
MNEKEPKIFLIEEGLYQGGERKYLPEEIDAVLALNPPFNTVSIDPNRFAQVWMPIEDGYFPGQKWLDSAVGVVENFRNMGKNVYVHCLAGRSRSGMVVAAYLIKKHAITVSQALEQIGAINPDIDPNPRFKAGLKEYYEKLYKGA